MSNIFAPWVRPTGTLPLNVGTGAIVGGIENQHLWFDTAGKIYAVEDGTLDHYGAGLPFDQYGRLIVSGGDVNYWDQDIPFTASGVIAANGDDVSYVDQGLAFSPTGHVVSSDLDAPEDTPAWESIPDKLNYQYELAQDYDVSPYASGNGSVITGYTLITPPAGFTNVGGVVTCAVGTAVAAHAITIRATNAFGDNLVDGTFTWTIILGNVPTWTTIPDRSDRENTLPQIYDVSGYASSDSGAILSYDLVAPPSGFSVSPLGVITSAVGTAVAAHSITVRATNGVGTSGGETFTWNVLEELVVPQWDAIPDQSTAENDLPDTLDASLYVTTNDGALTAWSITPISGITISQAGLITVAVGTAKATHALVVTVSNNQGPASSGSFNWVVSDELLPPQWSAIPDQSTFDDDLPATLDVTPYVSSNDGALTGWSLVTPPTGFTIDGAGVVTVAGGTALAAHSITVRVSNGTGSADSAAFTWTVADTPEVPNWSTVPAQETEVGDLPVILDLKPHVTSNSGALDTWSLVSPPGGWTIDQNGVITVAASRPIANNSITARVSNDTGTSDSAPFAWNIIEDKVVPQWSTVPPKSSVAGNLPQTYDMTAYVSTNSGPLTGWTLLSPPSGFSIDGSGVITAAGGTAVAFHALTVRVSNDEGSADSDEFLWEVTETPTVPQWSTVPPKTTTWEQGTTDTYSMAPYVTSNVGQSLFGYTINPPVTGFSINSTSGTITMTRDTAGAGVHVLNVSVSNATGTTFADPFNWTLNEELLVPQWSTIPDQDTDDTDLPATLDLKPYVTSNSGALTNWGGAVDPPQAWAIDQNGIVTAEATLPPDVYTLTASVDNDTGKGTSDEFTWTINATATLPFFVDFTVGSPISLNGLQHYRNSAATGFDDVGVLQSAGTHTPAYLGAAGLANDTGSTRGVQQEGASTNRLDDSNMSGFSEINCTATYNQTDSQGRANGAIYLEDATTSAGRFDRGGRATTNGVVHCISVRVKKNSNTDKSVLSMVRQESGGGQQDIKFDPTTGYFTHTGRNGGSYGMIDEGDWWRVWCSVDSQDTNLNFRIYPAYTDDPTPGITGSVPALMSAIVVCDAQYEEGSYPTSFIETTGTAAGRALVTIQEFMDALPNLPTSGFRNNWCGQLVYTLTNNPQAGDQVDALQVKGDDSDLFEVRQIGSTEIEVRKWHSWTAVSLTVAVPAMVVGDIIDLRFRFSDTTGMKVWFNISTTNSNASTVDSDKDCNLVYLGNDAFNGHRIVEQLRIVPEALSDAEIEAWPVWPPEAQAVLDRMTNLSATEQNAIIQFVASQRASGNWDRIDEFWCFALNGTDWLNGWKGLSDCTTNGAFTRTSNGASCPQGSNIWIDSGLDVATLSNFSTGDAAVGSYVHSYGYTGSSTNYNLGVFGDNSRDVRLHYPTAGLTECRFAINNSSLSDGGPITQAEVAGTMLSVQARGGVSNVYYDGVAQSNELGVADVFPTGGHNLYIGAANDGEGGSAGTTRQQVISAAFVGGGDIDLVNLNSNLRKLNAALGVT